MLSGMFAFFKMCRGTFMGCLLFLGTWDWDWGVDHVYRIFVGLFMGCLRVSVGVLEVLLEVDGIWSDFT